MMNHQIIEEIFEDSILRIPKMENLVPLVLICRSDDSIALAYSGSRYLSGDRMNDEEFYNDLSFNLVNAGFATIQKKYPKNVDVSSPRDATSVYRAEKAWIEHSLSYRYRIQQVNGKALFLLAHGISGYIVGNLEFQKDYPIGYIFASCPYHPYDYVFMNHCEHIRQYYSLDIENEKKLMEFDPIVCALLSSFGVILRAARKNRTHANISTELGKRVISLNPPLFSSDYIRSSFYTKVQSPSLIIHGVTDSNVPLGEVLPLEQTLKYHGVEVYRELILGSDHWFRDIPSEGIYNITDLITGKWKNRPYRDQVFTKIISYCNDIIARNHFSDNSS